MSCAALISTIMRRRDCRAARAFGVRQVDLASGSGPCLKVGFEGSIQHRGRAGCRANRRGPAHGPASVREHLGFVYQFHHLTARF